MGRSGVNTESHPVLGHVSEEPTTSCFICCMFNDALSIRDLLHRALFLFLH